MKFDTDKVFKIVSNLLSNAFKFTPEGGTISVTLSLRLEKEERTNWLSRCRIAVSVFLRINKELSSIAFIRWLPG